MQIGRKFWIIAILAVSLVGCGDEDTGPKAPPDAPAHLKGIKAAATVTVVIKESGTIPVPSEKWDRIRPHVERFIGNPVYARTDPFRKKLPDILVKRRRTDPRPPEEVAAEAETTTEPSTESDLPPTQPHPLQLFGLDELRLVMIMHGIAQPEAVFVDPGGQPWIVRTGTPIGKKRGQKVRSIKQYKVYVDEPDNETDFEIGIAPTILTRTFEGDKDAPEQPSFYAEPLTQVPVGR